MISVRQCLVAVVLFSLFATPSIAQEKDYVPQSGTFAPMDKSRYIAGELVYIDPVNRRGGIRLDGDEKGRYFTGPLHYFALLPYATVWHNGALAEIRDIPIGTHVHGYFSCRQKARKRRFRRYRKIRSVSLSSTTMQSHLKTTSASTSDADNRGK